MAPAWQAPEEWQKDGSTISGISSLKTGAWTSMLSAKETRNGKEIEVVIKTFSVPQEIVDDPQRVAREREKFLASARLQKQLSDASAPAWIRILRISEDPSNTSFSMEKSGASLEDLLTRKVRLTTQDLYEITLSVLQGFEELMQRHKRSHGSLKASDVLCMPGENPPYRLADPAPTGDTHSANDLYALGLILFQLIENKEWDPLTPIIPTSNWARFGSRRDRWIQFLNMLLSPNGCQEPLANVRREALRLKPGSPVRNLTLIAAGLFILLGVGVAVVVFSLPYIRSQLNNGGGGGGGGGAGGGGPVVVTPTVDPQVKADWEKSRDTYSAIAAKWSTRERTERYDHTKSTEAFRAGRALITDQQLTDTAAYQKSADAYTKATAKLQEALTLYADENKVGEQQDSNALADFQKAMEEFNASKALWDATAATFDARHDHTRSLALAQATVAPTILAPADVPGRQSAAAQLRAAAARYTQALAMAKEEELTGKTVEQAKADFQDARGKYQSAKDTYDAAAIGVAFNIATAKAAADKARATIPEQLVLTDVASYQKATDAFTAALTGYQQALALLEQAKRDHNAQESDASTSLARAAQALEARDYAGALSWYRKAADLGNASAMFSVGLYYETGRGTDKNAAEAGKWYQRAADLNHTAAMVNLGLLYERGQGVEKDNAKALALYKKAADLKDPAAMRNIAFLYDNGIGVQKDPVESLRWYRRGAELNDPSSCYCIGLAYEQGKGVTIDYAQAVTWYTKAADLKYSRAMNSLGVLHETGKGVRQDAAAAMEWYKKAADLNFAPAMSNIGALYDNGIGVRRDATEAFKWFHKGADLGHAMSMYNLAVLYETGRGTTSDINQALDWYRKAAATDDAQAKKQALDRLEKLGFRP